MPSKKVIIINKLGLHARAASKFVKLSSTFSCEIKIRHNNQEANGKSIMSVMMLAATQGTEIEIIANGNDHAQALQTLEQLVLNRFGEEQ